MHTSVVTLLYILHLGLVYGHSWLDCVQVTNPNQATFLNNMNCGAFPRGYAGRYPNPDANMHKIEGISPDAWWDAPACNQNYLAYSNEYPMLRANAGSTFTVAYTPNGHTRWHNPPPPNGPRNFWVHWNRNDNTKPITTMRDMHYSPVLFSTIFDDPCHNRNTGAQLDSSAGLCMADITIPADTPSGTYQFVWFWPFNFSNAAIEHYTTCWDVEVTGTAPNPTTTTTSSSSSTTASSSTGSVVIPDGIDYYASKDAYVRGGDYSGDAYGTTDPNQLYVKGVADVSYARESYLGFAIGDGNIVSAYLILQKTPSSANLDFNVAVALDDSWNEATISWNTKPDAVTVVGHVNENGVAELDVSLLRSYAQDKFVSLRLFDNSNQNVLMNVYSKEAGSVSAPKLRLVVDSTPQTCTCPTISGPGGSPVPTDSALPTPSMPSTAFKLVIHAYLCLLLGLILYIM